MTFIGQNTIHKLACSWIIPVVLIIVMAAMWTCCILFVRSADIYVLVFGIWFLSAAGFWRWDEWRFLEELDQLQREADFRVKQERILRQRQEIDDARANGNRSDANKAPKGSSQRGLQGSWIARRASAKA